ncbi:MAG: glycogen debranching protein GlgX [Pseudomonadota bacterium]
MLSQGDPTQLGATIVDGGTNFAVFSSVAERVELCLFDQLGNQIASQDFPNCTDHVWHGYLNRPAIGQSYGYRVHGPRDTKAGLRCNPSNLLLDPYAKQLTGSFSWRDAVYDHNDQDSGPFVPKGIVTTGTQPQFKRPRIHWRDTIFYEANVRGFTMKHPGVSETERGKFAGMRNGEVLYYLKSLGITSLELMPIHMFMDEVHLCTKGLRNYWGYNSLSFFAPSNRYATQDGRLEFVEMVQSIHDAGIEVILDVVYNHTAEGDQNGPSLCYRGLDNLVYYSTVANDSGTYVNDTGCGNTLNTTHPVVQRMVIDSLIYWHKMMGVDGFRFDLAPVLGRNMDGFCQQHDLLQAITSHPQLSEVKMIAEPWDAGPGGYQLGNFPGTWAEWNDRFRDSTRRFWRGDSGMLGELAERLCGSADIFDKNGRKPLSSVNFVSCHDGFTLADAVSYEQRHNHSNGENNLDGHAHNFSCNYGTEGPTNDPSVQQLRRRHRLNLLATLFFSRGIPLLLAGDEFGHSQNGNNNAYAQDNDTTWLDWSKLTTESEFLALVKQLIKLRKETHLLRLGDFIHGQLDDGTWTTDILWLADDGTPMTTGQWSHSQVVSLLLSRRSGHKFGDHLAICLNGSNQDVDFLLPGLQNWKLTFGSDEKSKFEHPAMSVAAHSVALLLANVSDSNDAVATSCKTIKNT